MKMNRAECGRLGALALNSNPEKKAAAAKKAVVTIKAARPNFYSVIGRLGAMKKKERKRGEDVNVQS